GESLPQLLGILAEASLLDVVGVSERRADLAHRFAEHRVLVGFGEIHGYVIRRWPATVAQLSPAVKNLAARPRLRRFDIPSADAADETVGDRCRRSFETLTTICRA